MNSFFSSFFKKIFLLLSLSPLSVWVCMVRVGVHVAWRPRLMMLAYFLSHSPPCLLIWVRIGLWTWNMLIWLSWLAGMEGPKLLLCSQSVSPPPTHPHPRLRWDYRSGLPQLVFRVSDGNPDSGPHTGVASTLLIKSPPHPLFCSYPPPSPNLLFFVPWKMCYI